MHEVVCLGRVSICHCHCLLAFLPLWQGNVATVSSWESSSADQKERKVVPCMFSDFGPSMEGIFIGSFAGSLYPVIFHVWMLMWILLSFLIGPDPSWCSYTLLSVLASFALYVSYAYAHVEMVMCNTLLNWIEVNLFYLQNKIHKVPW
jgi:hypothetical protein